MRVRLGDVCDRGTSNLKQSDITDTSGEYPVYGASGLIGTVSFYHQKLPYVAVVKDGAGIGRTTLHPAESSVIGTMQYLLPKADILPEYLYYVVKHMHLEKYYTGATIPHIYFKDYKSEEFNLESLEKQHIIVDMLEKIESVIEARQNELKRLDDLIKSRFVEMFGDPITNTKGWKIEKAEKHIDLLSGFPFDSSQYTQYGVKICGGLIIMPQRIDWNSSKYWSSAEDLEEYTLQEKDIVMALDRPWISEGFKIAMVDADELPALLIQRTARIRAVDINQYYLMHCFALGGFDIHCNVTGSLVPHISAKDIRSFPIMLPPIELQKKFAVFVEQIDKSKVAVQKALDEAQLLFDSLMQKYFQ